uniref:Uncharacterized protein n=1 Tax=Avena sativa TaxID=4498 RepID=A0ACD5X3Z0_AVESA
MTQWVPDDASGGEATKEAPLLDLDLEKCAPEEQAAPSPAEDGDATTSGQSGTCGQWFLRVILGAVWLYVVNQMRIYVSACEDEEARPMVAFMMVVNALSLASVFCTICVGEEPFNSAARSRSPAPPGRNLHCSCCCRGPNVSQEFGCKP